MIPPTIVPPLGIYVPVTYHRTRDGDTPEVQIRGGSFVWAVRLKDAWCPELNRGSLVLRKIGYEAYKFANQTVKEADNLVWYIPFSDDMTLKGMNPLKLFSFDRVLGYLYINKTQTLNQMLIDKGYASSTKGGKLGI